MLFKFAKFSVLAVAVLALSACGTMRLPNNVPSFGDEGESPRATTMAASVTVIDVMNKLADIGQLGLLPPNFADDIVEFAPDVEKVATAYLDATAACVVIDGALQTDKEAGGRCQKSTILRAFGDVSDLLWKASLSAGIDTSAGRALGISSVLLRNQLAPAPGGVVSGYMKVDDIPLEQFDAMRGELRAARDRLLAAAKANAALGK